MNYLQKQDKILMEYLDSIPQRFTDPFIGRDIQRESNLFGT